MLRILLKVYWVTIRLKEEVQVQCSIKSKSQHLVISKKALLKGGQAEFNAYSQFFINCSEPIFEINVIVIHGEAKKFIGAYAIDLRNWEERANNQTSGLLEKCPDSKAKIRFDFMYMTTNIEENKKNMLCVDQYESTKNSETTKNIENQNFQLNHENSRLTLELDSLKQQNVYLAKKQSLNNEKYSENNDEYIQKINKKDKQIIQSQNSLSSMVSQMNRVRAILEQNGQQNLIYQMDNIINQERDDRSTK